MVAVISKIDIVAFLLKWCFFVPIYKTENAQNISQKYRISNKLKLTFFLIRLTFAGCSASIIITSIVIVDYSLQVDFVGKITGTLKRFSEESLSLVFYVSYCCSLPLIVKILNTFHTTERRTSKTRKITIIVFMIFGLMKPVYEMCTTDNNWDLLLTLFAIKYFISFGVLQANIFIWTSLVSIISEELKNSNKILRSLLKETHLNQLTIKLEDTRKLYDNLYFLSKDINSYFAMQNFFLIAIRYCNVLFALFELSRIIDAKNPYTWILVCSIFYYCEQMFKIVAVCTEVHAEAKNLIETLFEADRTLGHKSANMKTLVSIINELIKQLS